MNLYLNITDFKPLVVLNDNIRFLYAKQNTIMDGKFTKILYSDNLVIMNGLYLLFPILCDTLSPNNSNSNSNIRYIQNNRKTNIQLIEEFTQLENIILTHYQNYNNCDKYKELSLHKQLYHNKQIRVYKESANKPLNNTIIEEDTAHNQYINQTSIYTLKISGVWETFDKIGITYKIVEIRVRGTHGYELPLHR